jgi:MFS family permease
MKDLSARHFVIIGSSMTFLGLVLSSFVTSLSQLIFTFSTITGIGIGLLNPAAFVAVLSCFTSQRTYAISIGFAALGLGQMMMPMFVKQLLIDYDNRTAIFIMSGVSLTGLVGGNFLVPIKWKPLHRPDIEAQPLIIRKSIGQSSIVMEIIQATDLDLLWNLKYLTIIFGLIVVYASAINLNIIFPIYLLVSKITRHQEKI